MPTSDVAPAVCTPEASGLAVRCSHCGQILSETVHAQRGYRVGHYRLELGYGRPTLVTCAECYARPDVRAERDRLWMGT